MDLIDARQKYIQQRNGAKARGIPWGFTFSEWCETWIESGKWEERGSSGYVMARKRDLGGYSPGNVEIIPNTRNLQDGHDNRKMYRAHGVQKHSHKGGRDWPEDFPVSSYGQFDPEDLDDPEFLARQG